MSSVPCRREVIGDRRKAKMTTIQKGTELKTEIKMPSEDLSQQQKGGVLCNQERNSKLEQKGPDISQFKKEQEEVRSIRKLELLVWRMGDYGAQPAGEKSKNSDLQQQQKEVFTDHQPCKQKRNSSLDQEPELPQIKVEQKEIELPQIKEEQGEIELPRVKEEEDKMELPRVKEEEDEMELSRVKEEEDEIELSRVKEEEDEIELSRVKEEKEEMELPRVKEEKEEMELPRVKEGEEEMELPQRKQLVLKQETEATYQGQGFSGAVVPVQLFSHNFLPIQIQSNNLSSATPVGISPNVAQCVYIVYGYNAGQSPVSESQLEGQPSRMSFQCGICGETFSTKFRLKKHALDKKHVMEPVRPVEKHTCDTCGECFTRKNDLVGHMKAHPGVKPFSCKTCGKGYRSQYVLMNHIVTSHPDEKPFSCGKCGESFRLREMLYEHGKVHYGNGLHSCELCGKFFSRESYLKEHMIVHTCKKPYSCDVCRKKFNQKSAMRAHMKTHEGSIFTCEKCGKKFPQSRNLVSHMKFHF